MSRTITLLAALALALVVSACASSGSEPPVQYDGGGADRMLQHDSPVQDDGPVQTDAAGDTPVQLDSGQQDTGQQDAGPATLYADIRYLQQDPALTGLAPIGSRVRIEGAVVTASGATASVFFMQNATGQKEYSGIAVKKNATIATMPAVGDVVTAIEGTLIEEVRSCNIDASTCPTRHAINQVTLFTVSAGTGTVPAPLGITTSTLTATPAKYDGVLVQLTDSPLTVTAESGALPNVTLTVAANVAFYSYYYAPPGIPPVSTVITTGIGVVDIYNTGWELYPRVAADLVFQDWPPDGGVQLDSGQQDSGQQDATSSGDAAPCTGAVVISQVYGGGGNAGPPAAQYKNDFVELFNRSNATIDVSTWSVQYAAYNGTSWTVVALTGKSIPAGGYLLVQFGSGGSTGAALPTADVTSGTNLSATHGKVALVNNATAFTTTCPLPSANIVDFVGFGTDPTCSEGTKAPAGANDQAVIRKSAGCQDYNDNGYDFAAGAPNPRNSATTAAPCGC